MGEREVEKGNSAGNFGSYCVDDNRKLGLVVDYAYYMEERHCTRVEDRRRTSEEFAAGEQP